MKYLKQRGCLDDMINMRMKPDLEIIDISIFGIIRYINNHIPTPTGHS
jgi:hypothetical protein